MPMPAFGKFTGLAVAGGEEKQMRAVQLRCLRPRNDWSDVIYLIIHQIHIGRQAGWHHNRQADFRPPVCLYGAGNGLLGRRSLPEQEGAIVFSPMNGYFIQKAIDQ